jgi:hypothetical protein
MMEALPLDVRDTHDALLLADTVAALNPLDHYKSVPDAVRQLTGGAASATLYPRSFPAPAWLWLDTATQVVVAFAGVLTAADGLGVFATTSLPPLRSDGWGGHPSCVIVARQALSRLAPTFGSGPRDWVLAGHSYGGGIAQTLAQLLAQASATRSVQVLTFGSPRPGDADLADKLSRFTVRRLMNAGDHIPRWPPHVDEAPLLLASLPSQFASSWPLYTQPGGGLVLSSAGELYVAPLPPVVPFAADLELGALVVGSQLFQATPHSISAYQSRLALARSSSTGVRVGPTVGSWTEAAGLAIASKTGAPFGGGATLTTPLDGGTLVAGYIPPTYRADWHHMGGSIYKVTWMGQTVMTGSTRSNARSLAKHLNTYLSKMQGAASVDHANFEMALSAFWQVCTQASLGFNPPLNVT